VYEHLGDILEKLSRKEEALEAWKTAFELSPELPELRNKIKKAQDNRAP
jgi:tetratricopeptide (TPR) repeat protein